MADVFGLIGQPGGIREVGPGEGVALEPKTVRKAGFGDGIGVVVIGAARTGFVGVPIETECRGVEEVGEALSVSGLEGVGGGGFRAPAEGGDTEAESVLQLSDLDLGAVEGEGIVADDAGRHGAGAQAGDGPGCLSDGVFHPAGWMGFGAEADPRQATGHGRGQSEKRAAPHAHSVGRSAAVGQRCFRGSGVGLLKAKRWGRGFVGRA